MCMFLILDTHIPTHLTFKSLLFIPLGQLCGGEKGHFSRVRFLALFVIVRMFWTIPYLTLCFYPSTRSTSKIIHFTHFQFLVACFTFQVVFSTFSTFYVLFYASLVDIPPGPKMSSAKIGHFLRTVFVILTSVRFRV